MPVMVKMKPTDTMPEKLRKSLYMTRRLLADDGTFEASPNEVRLFSKARWAELVQDDPAPRRRGRPRKAQPEPEPTLEEKTVPELREMAEDRGVDLPSGYVKKDELVEKISEAEGEDDYPDRS